MRLRRFEHDCPDLITRLEVMTPIGANGISLEDFLKRERDSYGKAFSLLLTFVCRGLLRPG